MPLSRIVLLASLCLPTAAFSQVAAPAPAPVAKPVKEKKICRSEVPIGSIMATRVCMTKSEHDALGARNGAAAERALESVRDRASAGLSATNQ